MQANQLNLLYINQLKALAQRHFGRGIDNLLMLKAHASTRKIYRISAGASSAIGIYNSCKQENHAFIEFSRHFKKYDLPVPEIYLTDLDQGIYLMQDLGDKSLYDFIREQKLDGQPFPQQVESLLAQALSTLARFQIIAAKNLDFDLCYPTREFSVDSMLWDMHYFRDNFLLQSGVPFDREHLQNDFNSLAQYLDKADRNYFMYRDFQSRNIMLNNGKLYFIDYQGGRHGALQYDVASLLYQSRAQIPKEVRERLLNVYLDSACSLSQVDRSKFLVFYQGFALLRLMQVLGAYGNLGLRQGKILFIESIPLALYNLKEILDDYTLNLKLGEMTKVLTALCKNIKDFYARLVQPRLQINIISFSYKRGIPTDKSEHGGGYVFDCRGVPNPGREEKFKNLSGLDQSVQDYIAREENARTFLEHSFALVDQSVESYLARGFDSLSVSFGCTGGQHRSVYFAQKLAEHLKQNYNVNLHLKHLGLEELGIKYK